MFEIPGQQSPHVALARVQLDRLHPLHDPCSTSTRTSQGPWLVAPLPPSGANLSAVTSFEFSSAEHFEFTIHHASDSFFDYLSLNPVLGLACLRQAIRYRMRGLAWRNRGILTSPLTL